MHNARNLYYNSWFEIIGFCWVDFVESYLRIKYCVLV